jgi:DNA ligase D-like protein (predicted 3'-phosphoesterase)
MSDRKNKLSRYEKKRKFDKTSEPGGAEDVEFDWAESRPIFVIQKHDASSLHYDFRLEIDGVLASWAVPKGPSTDPSQKRLAQPTEDHPLAYADFEGVIPEDEYGGGTVMVWDRGTYENAKEPDEQGKEPKPVADQLEDGHITVRLRGRKISGGYALVRTGSGDDARWLLVKMDDDQADRRRNPTSTENESVKTGRTLEQISREESDAGD